MANCIGFLFSRSSMIHTAVLNITTGRFRSKDIKSAPHAYPPPPPSHPPTSSLLSLCHLTLIPVCTVGKVGGFVRYQQRFPYGRKSKGTPVDTSCAVRQREKRACAANMTKYPVFSVQRDPLYFSSVTPYPRLGGPMSHVKFRNKGFSRPRHLQGKGCKTGLCRQAWSFPLFDPM